MQNLEVISINIWQILISLANLLILFVLLKKFLYKPVRKMLEQRQSEIDDSYKAAEEAKQHAQASEQTWNEKIQHAEAHSSEIIQQAAVLAGQRKEQILAEAKAQADGIVRQAEQEAILVQRKAEEEMKQEIVSVSALLTEKLLDREINAEDHRKLIDTFIDEIGDDHEGNA